MHEVLHVADAVEGGDFLLYKTILVVEELDGVGEVQIVVDGVLIAVVLLREHAVDGQFLSDILNEMRYLDVAFVLPGIDVAPMLVESLLHLFHLLDGSLLGIVLHAQVEGGMNLQTFGVVGVGTVVTIVFLAPLLHPVGNGLAEVVGLAVVGILHTVVELYFGLFQRVAGFGCEVAVGAHIVEYDIAATEGILRIDARIIIGGGLEQSYEYGGLLGGHVLRRGAEIGLGSRLDAEGVGAEVDGIGIHGDDFLLGEVPLELVGRDPLLALHDEHLQSRDVAKQSGRILGADAEEVLGQLLGDGGCSAR